VLARVEPQHLLVSLCVDFTVFLGHCGDAQGCGERLLTFLCFWQFFGRTLFKLPNTRTQGQFTGIINSLCNNQASSPGVFFVYNTSFYFELKNLCVICEYPEDCPDKVFGESNFISPNHLHVKIIHQKSTKKSASQERLKGAFLGPPVTCFCKAALKMKLNLGRLFFCFDQITHGLEITPKRLHNF
jgi:hypothetical protein